MTKQVTIGIGIVLAWCGLGIFGVINLAEWLIGLLGFMTGGKIVVWEYEEELSKPGEVIEI